MIDYKKLFENKNIKFISDATQTSIGDEVESKEYLSPYKDKKERFIPPVDFTKPENFARFGSAEKYYIDSIKRIYNTYPYDGSLKERIQWENSSSYFDLHIFNNEYPRTNGYVVFSAEGWGTAGASSDGYGSPSTEEYILVKGGPNTSSRSKGKDIEDTSGDYKSGYANIYDLAENRESNLKIGGLDGNTVEFWLKKSEFLPSLTKREVLFDLYTTSSLSSSADYARLTIEMTGTADGSSPFLVTFMSGTAGFAEESIGSSFTTASLADDEWHHYAFTFKNSGANVQTKLYVDGTCNHTITAGTTVDYVSGNLVATIGSLAVAPSGTQTPERGWGKFSGSLDEFRFWKTARDSQLINRQMIQPVGGGANTDSANTDLGVYYKFNEGITLTSSVDSVILDYSGRVSNGSYQGYNTSVRETGSALVESGKVKTEFKDPILYWFHPDVKSFYDTKKEEGRDYDYRNNSSIYFTMPTWIIEEDEVLEESPLRNLTQIVGSYFDTLANNIKALPELKQKNYLSSSHKPYPFASRLLESVGFTYVPELFADAEILAQYRNRDERLLFAQKLYDTKNRIYQNIYNNIVYIYKTKGTEKSFRNLLRCFGVDNEVYKINTYANNGTYELKDNIKSVGEQKKYANFTLTGSNIATVYQYSSSANPGSTSFLSGSGLTTLANENTGLAFTMESEVVFPNRLGIAEVNQVASGSSEVFNQYAPVVTASLFGAHSVSGDTENDLTWATNDYGNFQVAAVKDGKYSKRCFFQLTGTAGGFMPNLTSSYYSDVFSDEKWNFSVVVKPAVYPEADMVDGTETPDYTVEFYGTQNVLDVSQREFLVTGTMTNAQGRKFMSSPKSVYVGAHRENFSGSLQEHSDANISSARVWMTALSTDTVKQHATDVKNYGAPSPYRSAYLYQSSMDGVRVPQIQTLALDWNFDTVTGSDASGQFIVEDFSSGSANSLNNRYNWIGDIVGKQHTGRGDNFPANFSGSINKKYLYSGKKQLPEIIYSADMVSVVDQDDLTYTRDTRPVNYYMFIEKSMYQTISEEIVKMFSTIKDFNNLIGEPVNNYRHNYKHMEKLRQLFFERVNNTPDLDKYVEYYKWLDSALNVMLGYLVPASSNISVNESIVKNTIESHVLERNKYRHKYPTFEDRTPDPEGKVFGINELLYDWKFGHAPVDENQADNCLWWKERAERDDALASGDSEVDADKQLLLDAIVSVVSASGPTLAQSSSTGITSYAGSAFALRKLTRPQRLKIDEVKGLHGGTNFSRNKNIDYFEPISRQFNSTFGLNGHGLKMPKTSFISSSCTDDSALNDKPTVDFTVVSIHGSTANDEDLGTGELFAPFNIVSSSVEQTDLTEVNLVNIHHDTYGYDKDVPLQSPFTSKFVGGKPYRHTWNNFDPNSNNMEDRAEGWRMRHSTTRIAMLEPTMPPSRDAFDADLARSVFYRDETAKRPVNIRNIQQQTGSELSGDFTVIGNYVNDYDILHTAGRTINNRYLIEVGGLSGSAVNSAAVEGLVDYAVPIRDISGSNKFIFVNRFSAPGGPAVSSLGTLDFEAAEYSVYNAIPYRNLTARMALNELYTDHTKPFGFFSDAQNSASYVLADETYPGTSGSVSADSYEGDPVTASYHKTNRNTRKTIKYSNAYTGDSGTTATYSVYDNWFVQHQIPQTDLQYAWITASIVSDYSGSALYGFEQPDWKNASLASTDLTFASASDGPRGTIFVGGRRGPYDPNDALFEAGSTWVGEVPGLNRNFYEPVTSSENSLGYPNGASIVSYFNPGIGPWSGDPLPLSYAEMSAMFFRYKRGWGGWSSWKQVRGASHPVIRTHRTENRISWLGTKALLTNPLTGELLGQSFAIKTQIEPPITSKYKPLVHRMNVKDGSGPNAGTSDIKMVHSYGNQLTNFTEKIAGFDSLNNNAAFGFWPSWRNRVSKKLPYNALNYFLLSGDIGEEVNPVESLTTIKVSETVYPREKYTYLKKVRQRENFISDFWRETRTERTDAGTLNPIYVTPEPAGSYDSREPTVKTSIWAMDARDDFTTNSPPTSSNDVSLDVSYGILQNDFTTFVMSDVPDRLRFSPLYGRRWPERIGVDGAAGSVIFGGDTKWEAGEQAGADPFYKDYDSYVEELKRHGKDYGIIPEFRMSEHIDFYVNQKGGDFLAENTASLSLTGASEANTTGDFYKIYNHSDFLKYFNVVETDYEGAMKRKQLTLSCDALIKFLPYDGFYPAQRTAQLVELFYNSYIENIDISGDYVDVLRARYPALNYLNILKDAYPQLARPVLQTLFSPGILFNTIKSGLAVDYPIMTSGYTVTGSWANSTTDGGIPRIASNFDQRVPFEALLEPENPAYLGGVTIIDQDVHPSASNSDPGFLTASIVGVTQETYKMGMHNFLAETVDFFLPKGNLTSFVSQPDNSPQYWNVKSGTEYRMRIICSHSKYRTTDALFANLNDGDALYSASYTYNPPTIKMYKREGSSDTNSNSTPIEVYGSSFGSPVNASSSYTYLCQSGANDDERLYTSASFAPFTPPYYGGFSSIVLKFTPTYDDKFTFADLANFITASADLERYPAVYDAGQSINGKNAMALTASINFLQGDNLGLVDVDPAGNPVVIKEGGPSRWVIQPKFETPILDFSDVDITLPTQGSGSVAKGMWHQYGSIPSQDSGVFLSVADIDGYESLADLVGFEKKEVKIGQIAPSKEISEGVVAIPFYVENGQQKRFVIPQPTINLANMIIDNKIDEYNKFINIGDNKQWIPSQNIIDMILKMKKYVLPPREDFVQNPDTVSELVGGAFAMFIFEFSTTLSQLDLAKIWQNLPPEIGRDLKEGSWKQQASMDINVFTDKAEKLEGGGTSLMGFLPANLQWKVFKVKRRAKYNYYEKTADSTDDTRFKIKTFTGETGGGNQVEKLVTPEYSYNWPYDFFSLVELVKMDASIDFKSVEGDTYKPKSKDAEEVLEDEYQELSTNAAIISNIDLKDWGLQ